MIDSLAVHNRNDNGIDMSKVDPIPDTEFLKKSPDGARYQPGHFQIRTCNLHL